MATLHEFGGGKASAGSEILTAVALSVFLEEKWPTITFCYSPPPPQVIHIRDNRDEFGHHLFPSTAAAGRFAHSVPNLLAWEVPKVKTQPGHLLNNALSIAFPK